MCPTIALVDWPTRWLVSYIRAESRLEESEKLSRSAQDQQAESESLRVAEAGRLKEQKEELRREKKALQDHHDRQVRFTTSCYSTAVEYFFFFFFG